MHRKVLHVLLFGFLQAASTSPLEKYLSITMQSSTNSFTCSAADLLGSNFLVNSIKANSIPINREILFTKLRLGQATYDTMEMLAALRNDNEEQFRKAVEDLVIEEHVSHYNSQSIVHLRSDLTNKFTGTVMLGCIDLIFKMRRSLLNPEEYKMRYFHEAIQLLVHYIALKFDPVYMADFFHENVHYRVKTNDLFNYNLMRILSYSGLYEMFRDIVYMESKDESSIPLIKEFSDIEFSTLKGYATFVQLDYFVYFCKIDANQRLVFSAPHTFLQTEGLKNNQARLRIISSLRMHCDYEHVDVLDHANYLQSTGVLHDFNYEYDYNPLIDSQNMNSHWNEAPVQSFRAISEVELLCTDDFHLLSFKFLKFYLKISCPGKIITVNVRGDKIHCPTNTTERQVINALTDFIATKQAHISGLILKGIGPIEKKSIKLLRGLELPTFGIVCKHVGLDGHILHSLLYMNSTLSQVIDHFVGRIEMGEVILPFLYHKRLKSFTTSFFPDTRPNNNLLAVAGNHKTLANIHPKQGNSSKTIQHVVEHLIISHEQFVPDDGCREINPELEIDALLKRIPSITVLEHSFY
ncbi:hypothetical protein ENBRE01_2395 [Enteropsectra breve]|nr:hypothetical protein ENBRE01_2395 [Enteropsectra breve]